MAEQKLIKCIILDAGPLLLNDPPISTLIAKSEKIYTTPAVLAEVRDPNARARLHTTIVPFLIVQSPHPASTKAVSDFAKRTGDFSVLSKADLQVLALAYELECERNRGDWRLRKVPGQKTLNGPPPKQVEQDTSNGTQDQQTRAGQSRDVETQDGATQDEDETDIGGQQSSLGQASDLAEGTVTIGTDQGEKTTLETSPTEKLSAATDSACIAEHLLQTESLITETPATAEDPTVSMEALTLNNGEHANAPVPDLTDTASEDDQSDKAYSEGWITPSNLKKHQAKHSSASTGEAASSTLQTIQVATITGDFAMQNVLLQMNLNLMGSSLKRIQHLKTHVLRCYACFAVCKEMTKQFCPRCGKPTLTRVSCSTKADGTFTLHLRKNFQYNLRGDRYSIPKPVAGSANGRVGQGKGGGKNGWGRELLLAEDQKEYVRAISGQGRAKERNLMDEDYLPNILTGERASHGSRPKIGAGRNVNSRKR